MRPLGPTEWGGVSVPEGTQVLIPNTFLHRDRDRYEYADRFAPERWVDGDAADEWSFNHFSRGPQGCPGVSLAMLLGRAALGAAIAGGERRARLAVAGPGPPDARHARLLLDPDPERRRVSGGESSGDALRAVQEPLKERYREAPAEAVVTLSAEGTLDEGIACKVTTGAALVEAGLHPATGGSGLQACSGDMLLEALVACAGVTMRAVAASLGIEVEGTVHAEGDLDFRGTLAVDREAPVGFREIRLRFELESDAGDERARDARAAHRALLRRLPDAREPAGALGDDRARSSGDAMRFLVTGRAGSSARRVQGADRPRPRRRGAGPQAGLGAARHRRRWPVTSTTRAALGRAIGSSNPSASSTSRPRSPRSATRSGSRRRTSAARGA